MPLCHFLVRAGRSWLGSFGNGCQHRFVGEMHHHNIAGWVVRAQMSDNAFHSTYAIAACMVGILIIVDRKFNKNEINWPLSQNIFLKPECACGGACGSDTGICECEFCLGKPLR